MEEKLYILFSFFCTKSEKFSIFSCISRNEVFLSTLWLVLNNNKLKRTNNFELINKTNNSTLRSFPKCTIFHSNYLILDSEQFLSTLWLIFNFSTAHGNGGNFLSRLPRQRASGSRTNAGE